MTAARDVTTGATRVKTVRAGRRAGMLAVTVLIGGLAPGLSGGAALAFDLRSTQDSSVMPGWRGDRSTLPAVKRRSTVNHSRPVTAYRQVSQRKPVFVQVVDGQPRFLPILVRRQVVVAPPTATTARVEALSQEVRALGQAIDELKARLPEPQARAEVPPAQVRPRVQPKLILLDDRELPDVTVYRGLARGL